MIVGAAFGSLWMWRPLSKISSLSESTSQIRHIVNKNLAIYYVVASIILVSSNFAILYFQAIAINGSVIDVLGTRFGTVLLERSLISFIILGLSLYEYRQFRKKESHTFSRLRKHRNSNNRYNITGYNQSDWAWSSSKQLTPLIIDFVHNLTASIWIGGTFYLAFVLIPILKASKMNLYYKLATLSVWIPRYSTLVVTLLGILIITGPFLLHILEDNLSLVIGSLYVYLFDRKFSLAGLMVILGGYEHIYLQSGCRFIESPQVVGIKPSNYKLPNGESESERKAESTIVNFRRALVIESILGIALLLSVGLLVNTGVPESEMQNLSQASTAESTRSNIMSQLDSLIMIPKLVCQ